MSNSKESKYYLVGPGSRPPYYEIADFLWGKDANIDSDGNSNFPNDLNWTELTISLRNSDFPSIVVDPVSEDPLVLKIRSTSNELAFKVAEFLSNKTGGKIESEYT